MDHTANMSICLCLLTACLLQTIVESADLFDGSKPFKNTNREVVFAHVLFRHGSRMPLDFYPNDPYKDPSNWGFGIAQLTDVGMRQEYELGRWLRSRYDHLLGPVYDADQIYVQSTDVDRTLMSAQCCMAGLYPAVAWQPVPVHTIPGPQDNLLGASSTYPCPAFNEELQRASNLPEILALQERFKPMYDYVSNHTGNSVRNFSAAIKIYDDLAIEEEYNMSIPEWAKAVYPEPIREAGLYSFALPTWTPLLQRLKTGPLLKDMVERFQAKRTGQLTPDRSMWVYSAHDATVSALLNTFNVFEIHFPPYAACVTLELRLINQEYFVTLFYRNSTVAEPTLLPIKTCDKFCPLDQFITLVQPLLPTNWEDECGLHSAEMEQYVWIAVLSVSGVVGCIIITILCLICIKNKKTRTYLTMPSPFFPNRKDLDGSIHSLPK